MVKENYVNSAYCKIATCILKRREYVVIIKFSMWILRMSKDTHYLAGLLKFYPCG